MERLEMTKQQAQALLVVVSSLLESVRNEVHPLDYAHTRKRAEELSVSIQGIRPKADKT